MIRASWVVQVWLRYGCVRVPTRRTAQMFAVARRTVPPLFFVLRRAPSRVSQSPPKVKTNPPRRAPWKLGRSRRGGFLAPRAATDSSRIGAARGGLDRRRALAHNPWRAAKQRGDFCSAASWLDCSYDTAARTRRSVLCSSRISVLLGLLLCSCFRRGAVVFLLSLDNYYAICRKAFLCGISPFPFSPFLCLLIIAFFAALFVLCFASLQVKNAAFHVARFVACAVPS